MLPQLQCPNCLQFEFGFRRLLQESFVDHQNKRLASDTDGNIYIRCTAGNCTYTGRPEEFNTGA